jgi:hypothetical protein
LRGLVFAETTDSVDFLDSADCPADLSEIEWDGCHRAETANPFHVRIEKELFDMKRAIFFALVTVVLTGFCGCTCPPKCQRCSGGQPIAESGGPGQGGPMGTVNYPYYVTHGPRDFLDKNPQSIGP